MIKIIELIDKCSPKGITGFILELIFQVIAFCVGMMTFSVLFDSL